jgi:hypothetical protein
LSAYGPPALSFAAAEELTYVDLIGPLGADPKVAAECRFLDPVGDIAVLGPPDNQQFDDAADAYVMRSGTRWKSFR